ncbi:MAG: rhomboid family intramembrane serine protease [Magnetovibrio sp.]|nr:rhomboid family intramembrane serine protease [Magnetovibrio sp.]
MKLITKTLAPVLLLLTIIWVVEAVNVFWGHRLATWGILPRNIGGLIGIPLAPFLHAGIWHAVSNTIPLLILGGLTLTAGRKRFWTLTVMIVVVSGILVWMFARSSYHVGASGLVFGYFGALVTRAVIERSISSIVIALITISLYGGLLWGILPQRSYISFEGHFFGLIAGIASIWFFHKFANSKSARGRS